MVRLKKKGKTEGREEMKEGTEGREELKREGKTEKSQEVCQIDLVVHHCNHHQNHPGQRILHHYLS